MTARLRAARADDLAEIVSLEREIAELPHWQAGEYTRYLPEPDRLLLVAEGGACGGLLGFIAVTLFPALGMAEIDSLAVRAEARRQGTGRLLCGAAIAWSREAGARTVELEVRDGSAGARELYRSLGFAEDGRRPGYYANPAEDAVLMSLRLPEGAAHL